MPPPTRGRGRGGRGGYGYPPDYYGYEDYYDYYGYDYHNYRGGYEDPYYGYEDFQVGARGRGGRGARGAAPSRGRGATPPCGKPVIHREEVLDQQEAFVVREEVPNSKEAMGREKGSRPVLTCYNED